MKIKKIVESCLDTGLRNSKSFRDYVNTRYTVRDGWVLVDARYLDGIHYSHNGIKFHLSNMLNSIEEVDTDYNFDDILPTDTVLDIGACIGGFSLQAAKRAKHVFAVEPLYSDYLKANIRLNGITNVTVIDEVGLGQNDGVEYIKCGARQKRIKTTSLTNIIKSIGGCDFLKMDCEGAEWHIKPHELSNVRRIEGEIHCFNNNHNLEDFKIMLSKTGFVYTENRQGRHMLIHACIIISGKQDCDGGELIK